MQLILPAWAVDKESLSYWKMDIIKASLYTDTI